jgi:hypothetical protein
MSYYDINGRPIRREEGLELLGPRNHERQIEKTKYGDVTVSTVHLVIDHGGNMGVPVIFETMIFGGEHDEMQWRYATLEEAKAGHHLACLLAIGEDDALGEDDLTPTERESR